MEPDTICCDRLGDGLVAGTGLPGWTLVLGRMPLKAALMISDGH